LRGEVVNHIEVLVLHIEELLPSDPLRGFKPQKNQKKKRELTVNFF